MQNYTEIENNLLNFLDSKVKKAGYNSVILGLSGGLDSSIVAVLLKKVFDKNLKAIMMPSENSSNQSLKDAKKLCKKFNIDYEIKPISYKYYFKNQHPTPLRIGNFCARMRMLTLYDLSMKYNSLVIGTSNKSEIYLGYGTIHGDLAYALNPIGDLYKSELFGFAKYLKINKSIIKKPPSADLWEGQSDEAEFGFSYKQIDKVLRDFIDNNMSKKQLLKKNYDTKLVNFVLKRFHDNKFKRQMPIIATINKTKDKHGSSII